MMDAELLQQAGRQLAGWDRTMILSHARPDGDALGAMGAMKRVIEAAGRKATAFAYESVPDRYRFLDESCGFDVWPNGKADPTDARFDGILILDTCSWSQLEPVADCLRASRLPRIVVDHHATRDELAGQDADVSYVIDSEAASTCTMLYDWCEAMGWPIDAAAGEALFSGLSSDTGWFRFSNTDATTLRAAAVLIERGVRPDRVYARLYETRSPARLRLVAEVLSTLQFHADGALAVMWVSSEMFEFTGATPVDTEEIVNEPMATEGVAVSILLSDQGTGPIRVNFRSKSPEVCGRDVDVSALAQRFGGGGHRRAAGARVEGTLADVRDQVTTAAIETLAS